MCIKVGLKFSVVMAGGWDIAHLCLGFFAGGEWVVFLLFVLAEFFWGFFIPCFSSFCAGYCNGSSWFFLNLLLNLAKRMLSV